jgi:hypothetical protein
MPLTALSTLAAPIDENSTGITAPPSPPLALLEFAANEGLALVTTSANQSSLDDPIVNKAPEGITTSEYMHLEFQANDTAVSQVVTRESSIGNWLPSLASTAILQNSDLAHGQVIPSIEQIGKIHAMPRAQNLDADTPMLNTASPTSKGQTASGVIQMPDAAHPFSPFEATVTTTTPARSPTPSISSPTWRNVSNI